MSYSLNKLKCKQKRNFERKAQGICTNCDNKAEPNRTKCMECIEKDRKRSARIRKEKKRLGVMILGTRYK